MRLIGLPLGRPQFQWQPDLNSKSERSILPLETATHPVAVVTQWNRLRRSGRRYTSFANKNTTLVGAVGTRRIALNNPIADHPLNQGLVSWWLPLPNNQGGRTLFDIKGGNHGVLTGPTWAAGPNGFSGLRFDGSTDYASAALNLTALSGVSVSFWLNPTAFATSAGQFDMLVELTADGASNAGGFAVYNSGNPPEGLTIAHRGATGVSNAFYGFRPNLSQWTHYTFVGDFNLATDEVNLYQNGLLLTPSSRPSNTNNTGSSYANSTLWQAIRNGSSLPFNGSMSDLRVGRALSAYEVAALYDQTLRGHPDTLRRSSSKVWAYIPNATGAVTIGLAAQIGRLAVTDNTATVAVPVTVPAVAGRGVPVAPVAAVAVPLTVPAVASSGVPVAPTATAGNTLTPGAVVGNVAPVAPIASTGVTITPPAVVGNETPVAPVVTVAVPLTVPAVAANVTPVAPVAAILVEVAPGATTGNVTPVAPVATVAVPLTVPAVTSRGVAVDPSLATGNTLTPGAVVGNVTPVAPDVTVAVPLTVPAVAARLVVVDPALANGNTLALGAVTGSVAPVSGVVSTGLTFTIPVVGGEGAPADQTLALGNTLVPAATALVGTPVAPVVVYGVTVVLGPETTRGAVPTQTFIGNAGLFLEVVTVTGAPVAPVVVYGASVASDAVAARGVVVSPALTAAVPLTAPAVSGQGNVTAPVTSAAVSVVPGTASAAVVPVAPAAVSGVGTAIAAPAIAGYATPVGPETTTAVVVAPISVTAYGGLTLVVFDAGTTFQSAWAIYANTLALTMKKNTSAQVVSSVLIARTDGSPVTSGTVTVYVTIDGGTQAAGAGIVQHEGNGVWSYVPTRAETNGDSLSFLFIHAAAVPANVQVYTTVVETGSGSVLINHDYSGTDALTYRDGNGQGIRGATIAMYLTSDYEAGRLDNVYTVGRATTDAGGRWLAPIAVDPAMYKVVFYKAGSYGPDVIDLIVT